MKGQIIGTLTGGVLGVATGMVKGAKVGLAFGGPGGAMAGTIPLRHHWRRHRDSGRKQCGLPLR